MSKVKFLDDDGQKKFLLNVLQITNCPTIRELINRGFDINYSSLRNYFSQRRLLPYNFFKDLCEFSKLNENDFSFELINDNWGQVKGGSNSRK